MEQGRTEKRCGSKNYCGDVYAESRCGAAVFLGIAQRIERLSRSSGGMPHRNNFRFSPSIFAAVNRVVSEWNMGGRIGLSTRRLVMELSPLADIWSIVAVRSLCSSFRGSGNRGISALAPDTAI
jgi:hypothetical protein